MADALTFQKRRKVALQILTHGDRISRRGGAFLGQCAVDRTDLTEKQTSWFFDLAAAAGIDLEAE